MKMDVQLRNNIVAIGVVSIVLFMLVLSQVSQRGENTRLSGISMNDQVRQTISDHQVVPLLIEDQRLWVEVVTTPESITQGLSDRTEIGNGTPSQGMLFILPERRQPSFWMKNMHFDLDMIWIKDNQIVAITPNVPHPAAPQDYLATYSPNQAVDMVLELPAGAASTWKLQAGHQISFPTLSTPE